MYWIKLHEKSPFFNFFFFPLDSEWIYFDMINLNVHYNNCYFGMLLSKEENAILSIFACICNSDLAQILQNGVNSIRHMIS